MINEIKQLRIRIDGLAQLTKELKPVSYTEPLIPNYPRRNINSEEINKAYDSLILAKAWLGKVLGELGTESPYANDGNRKDVKDIEPTTDEANMVEEGLGFSNDWGVKSHIEKVDWLRQEIQNLIVPVNQILAGVSAECINAKIKAYSYLIEARFWLGFELGRIRDNEK